MKELLQSLPNDWKQWIQIVVEYLFDRESWQTHVDLVLIGEDEFERRTLACLHAFEREGMIFEPPGYWDDFEARIGNIMIPLPERVHARTSE